MEDSSITEFICIAKIPSKNALKQPSHGPEKDVISMAIYEYRIPHTNELKMFTVTYEEEEE